MKVNYQPWCSSHILTSYMESDTRSKRINKHGIDFDSNSILTSPSIIGFVFENENVGTMMNTMEKLSLNSFWDIREDGDYSTILLGRHHMFYTVDGSPLTYTNEYIKNNDEKILATTYDPVSFFQSVNHNLINTLKREDLYDDATYLKYRYSDESLDLDSLKNNLERKKTRKFSENHFAISGYNLLFQEISVDNNVINSIIPSGDFSWISTEVSSTIISLFDVTKAADKNSYEIQNDYMVSEKIEIPKFLYDGFGEFDHKCMTVINEFLSNTLIKKVEYCYSGKIFLKYNNGIEIGDTITLLDNVSSTYGIFRVDSFEHTLDSRGLITIVNVKAVLDFKDPLLDTYSIKIGYDLISELSKTLEKEETNEKDKDETVIEPKNKVIKKIMEEYLKFLIQSPKYTMLFHIAREMFFKPKIFNKNSVTPTPVPVRFVPMFVKGKIQMPESLKCVFFYNNVTNYDSFLAALYVSFRIGLSNAGKSIWNSMIKVSKVLADFFVSFYTLGLHELLKPALGITKQKALDSTFGTDFSTTNGEINSMNSYNPYTGGNHSTNEFLAYFFNIQMRKPEDISVNTDYLDKSVKEKENKINDLLINKNANIVMLVELYESFNHNGYNYKKLLNNFKTSYPVYKNESVEEKGYGSPFLIETSAKEYGATLFNQNNNQRYDVTSNTISIPGVDRYVVETIVKHTGLLEKRNQQRKNKTNKNEQMPAQYKIIWFHNLYGKKDDIQSIYKRRKNVENIIEYYENQYKTEVDENGNNIYGYIIMADCNLEITNPGTKPRYTVNGGKEEYYMLHKNTIFTQKIDSPTTLNKYGSSVSNLFDNVLISKNALPYVNVGRNDYFYNGNRTLISDHLPVFAKIDFRE